MAADYKQLLDPMTGEISGTVLRTADQAYVPDDPANSDRQRYLEWLADGNEPDPPDPLPEPTPPAPDPNMRLDTGVDAAVSTWHSNTPAARAGGQGGLSVEERLLRLEATVQAWASGQMQETKAPHFE